MGPILASALALLLAGSHATASALAPGDLVVSGSPAGEPVEGLYRVDPATRSYAFVAAGRFRDHAIDPTGALFAIAGDAVVRIDADKGESEPVPGGAALGALEGIAVDRAGILYLAVTLPADPPLDFEARIVRLDPASGASSALASGGFLGASAFASPLDLEVAPDGAPLVLATGLANSVSAVIRIEPTDGSQDLLTDATELLATSVGLGVAPDGSLLVTADGRALCECVALIDPTTGTMTGGSLRIEPDGEPSVSAVASDIGVGADGTIWLLAYAVAPIGSGLFRWDGLPLLEEDGTPYLPMSFELLGDVQAVLGICGDGEPADSEECDDGNEQSGDGCSRTCLAEACGNARVDANEGCDDGNLASGDGCDANCTPTACGNGVATNGEGCDDGNDVSGDGCDADCSPTGCGNGIATQGEACDDANDVQDDGCNDRCEVDFGPQTKRQRRCIRAVNLGVHRIARERARANERCLAAAVRGRLGSEPGAFDLCLDQDPRGSLARAHAALASLDREHCAPGELPELALATDRLSGSPGAGSLPSVLVRDLLGQPASFQPARPGAACQRTLLARANELSDAIWGELRRAKTAKLAGRGSAAAVSDADILSHVGPAVAGSRAVADATSALRARVGAACGSVTAVEAVAPGCAATSLADLASCTERAARCRSCLLFVEADPGIALDCDEFDDGELDQSCERAR